MEYFLMLPKITQIFFSSQIIINKCEGPNCINSHQLPSSSYQVSCSNATIRANKKIILEWMDHTKSCITTTRENDNTFIIYYVFPEWFDENGKYHDNYLISNLRSRESKKLINLLELKHLSNIIYNDNRKMNP